MIDRVNTIEQASKNQATLDKYIPKHLGQQSEFKEILTQIPGLIIENNFISIEEEKYLLQQIYLNEWNTSLERRTQHYGYQYNYVSKTIDQDKYLGPLPKFCSFLIERLKNQNKINFDPDQLIINEYKPGQGISPHIDRTDIFTDKIIVVSIGSGCIIQFTQNNKQKVDKYIQKRSLYIMSEESRYKWKHCIPGRKKDNYNNVVIERNTRVSLTFRKVKFNKNEKKQEK